MTDQKKEIIIDLIQSGEHPSNVSRSLDVSLKEVMDVLKSNNVIDYKTPNLLHLMDYKELPHDGSLNRGEKDYQD